MFDFALAADRLRARYYKTFPDVCRFKWDATSIKDRWYRRGTYRVVRESLGVVR